MNCFELLDKYFLIKCAAAERFVLSKYILRLLDVLIVQINLHSNWLLRVHLQISVFERTIQWMFGLAWIENKFMAINRFLSEWGVCFIELKIPWKWSVQVKASPNVKYRNSFILSASVFIQRTAKSNEPKKYWAPIYCSTSR